MNGVTGDVLAATAPIFVLVMIGYVLRRGGILGARATAGLSKLVLLFLFPILVFHRLAVTADSQQIIADWPVLMWAPVVLIGSALIGWGWYRLNGLNADFRTFVYLVGMPNWIYLPLAVAGPIWGDEAVRLIILFNIPTQLILWTAGIALLHGNLKGTHALRFMLTSPGLIAAVAGVLVAFGIIPLSFVEGRPGFSLKELVPLMHVVGGFTVPLSLVALGLYVGEKAEANAEIFINSLWVTAGRLLVAPLIIIGAVLLLANFGYGDNPMVRRVVYLIVSMPVAVSVPLFAAMFGRDRFLASRSVVISTMVGFITSPLLVMLALKLEKMLGL
jgi:predicted permease